MKKINLQLVGLLLTITGVQWGMVLSYYVPYISLFSYSIIIPGSAVTMAISILFLFNKNSFIEKKLPSFNKILAVNLFFQLLMLVYFCFNQNRSEGYLVFHFYIIALIFALSSLKKDFDYSKLPNYLYFSTLILLIWEAWMCNKGYVVGDYAWEQRQLKHYALEPFTFAHGALINIFSALCLQTNKRLLKKFLVVFSIILGIFVMFICNKRTPIFVLFIGIIFFFYWKGLISFKIKRRVFFIFLLSIIIAFIGFFVSPWFHEKMISLANNMYAGILNLLGNDSIQDATGSAMERVGYRNFAYNYINDNFNFFNILFGGGYAILWLDSPLLQSFLDMGLLGFCLYLFLILIYPARLLLIKHDEPTFNLARLLSLYALLSVFNSGHPYMWIKYAPICILSVIYCNLHRDGKT